MALEVGVRQSSRLARIKYSAQFLFIGVFIGMLNDNQTVFET